MEIVQVYTDPFRNGKIIGQPPYIRINVLELFIAIENRIFKITFSPIYTLNPINHRDHDPAYNAVN